MLTVALLAPIRVYKAFLSPLLPPMCRFHPSCSVYAMGAIGVHGPFKGLWLAVRRLTRCHPFNAGGLDPVPAKDGRKAEDVLRESFPFIAERLAAPPPPYLAAALPKVDEPDPSTPHRD
ncbi:MAG: membrane protein insertion efficiency factor YidD [Myxococcota bacterium]